MCISPLTLKRPKDEWQDTDEYSTSTRQVPCGQCYKCLGRRRNAWAFRLYHEMQISTSSVFMTLTYGINEKEGWGENPPTSFNGIYTLRKKHLQDFIKRLRRINNGTIKYYAVGEYGTNNNRPHYHIIMFNLDPHHISRSLNLSKQTWKKGNMDIAQCNIATINYTVGYLMQGAWQPQTDDDDRDPQFSTMSKKLGSNYLTDRMYNYHLERMETSVDHPSGFKMPMPRYYRDQIFSKEEKAELYEINQKLQSMNWEEFINIDYDMQKQKINKKIKDMQSNLKLKRATI